MFDVLYVLTEIYLILRKFDPSSKSLAVKIVVICKFQGVKTDVPDLPSIVSVNGSCLLLVYKTVIL